MPVAALTPITTALALIQAVIDPMIDQGGRIVDNFPVKNHQILTPACRGARRHSGFVELARQVAQQRYGKWLATGQYIKAGLISSPTLPKMRISAWRRRGYVPEKPRQTPLNPNLARAWMCGAHSGYLTGQNILIDGGSFNSTL